jgi:hypothetical protein
VASQLDGLALGAIAAGSLFTYAGVKGYSVPHALQALVKGQKPGTGGQANPITSSSGSGSSSGGTGTVVSGGSAQATLQKTAAQFGWGSGAQWQALQNVEMAEAGFNPQIKNSSSGALGLAQALGHGNANTAGTLGNEYGGYGLSDAQARAANSGDAGAQSLWMCNYIATTYGNPENAWAHEQSAGWY